MHIVFNFVLAAADIYIKTKPSTL